MFGLERGKSGSLLGWLILGVLAIAFGLGFGLNPDQVAVGESGLVKVYGVNVSKEDFAYQRQAISSVMPLPEGEQAQTWGVYEEVLEAAIERLVLTHVGQQLGLMTDTHDAEVLTRSGYYIVLDLDRPYPWAREGKFDYKLFKNDFLARYFLVSEPRYLEFQRQELLARQVRDLLAAATVVPEPEIWAEYEKKNNQLSLRYIRLPSRDYADLVDPSAAEVDGWMAEHAEQLDEMYEREAARFLKLPAEVDLRLIEIAKPMAPPEGAGEELTALWTENLAKAKAKAEAARAAVVEAGEPFPTVARRYSEDPDTARSGGRYGWTQVTGTGSGLDRKLDEIAQTLEDGQISEVIEGEESFFVIMVDGHREGDVPEDQAKRELATDAVRTARGRELAKQAAEEALLALREGKSMNQLFAPGEEHIEDYGVSEGPGVKPRHQAEETGLFNYGGVIPNIGAHPTLTNAAWAANLDEPVLGEVFEVPGGYLIAELADRQVATKEGFAEERAALYDDVAMMRSNAIISAFTKWRCYLGKATVDIRVNDKAVEQLMSYGGNKMVDDEGTPLTVPYRVCDRVGDRGGLLQLAALRGRGMAPPQP